MALTIELPDALQQKAEARAAHLGMSLEQWAFHVLEVAVIMAWSPLEERKQFARLRMQRLAAERGLVRDDLGSEERMKFIDSFIDA